MRDFAVIERYAKALFLSLDKNKISDDEALASLRALSVALEKNPQAAALLAHPLVSSAKKQKWAETVAKALASGAWGECLKNFLLLLARKKRLALLPSIAQVFESLADAHHGRIQTHVWSAKELSPTEKQALEKALSERLGKRVLVNLELKPDLLAGIVVHAGDMVLDNSLLTQLKHLKTRLVYGN